MPGQFQLAGRRVLSGQLVRPSIGVWHADLVVEGDAPLAGRADLVAEAGATLRGTAASRPDDGRVHVRLTGGGGGMGKKPRALGFRDLALRSLLTDTLGAVGEALSGASDAAAMGSRVGVYARLERTAAATVTDWARRKGLTWRVRPDGTVWLGPPARSAFSGEARVLRHDGERRALVVALEDLALGPEHTLEGLALGCVVYALRPASLRAEALYL